MLSSQSNGSASPTARPLSPASPSKVQSLQRLSNISIPGNAKDKLRGGQVLVPSLGSANEATRVRNNGRPLCASQRLMKSSSAPALGGFRNAKIANSSLPSLVQGKSMSMTSLEAKTPRTLRGLVRKFSAVQIDVPDAPRIGAITLPGRWCSSSTSQRLSGCIDSNDRTNDSPLARSQDSPRPNTADAKSASPKRVRWAEGQDSKTPLGPSLLAGIVKEGTPSPERVRSMQLLGCLYKLRRVGGNDDQTTEEPANVDVVMESGEKERREEEKQLSLMNQALCGVNDNEAELRGTIVMMASAHDPVCELGGARHATTLITGRSISVVKRKADLLKVSEENLRTFERYHAMREELCQQVIAGPFDHPDGYRNVKRMIGALVHRDPQGRKGNPADADKTNFEMFANSFGLPPNHSTLVKLQSLAVEATEWWADKMLVEALKGSDAFVLQRLIDFSLGFLNLSGHDKVTQVRDILGTRGAEKVIDIAHKLSAKDAQLVQKSTQAQPEHAKKVAEDIDLEIKKACSLGSSIRHPLMEQARSIAVGFHLEEKNRLALRVLQFAERKQEEDNKLVAEAGDNVPPVGPASDAGDLIEREVNIALKMGARPDHPHLMEAKGLMKLLRDEDGQRKRLAAREKRLAARSSNT